MLLGLRSLWEGAPTPAVIVISGTPRKYPLRRRPYVLPASLHPLEFRPVYWEDEILAEQLTEEEILLLASMDLD